MSDPAVMTSFDRAAPAYVTHARVQEAMAKWLAEWIPADRTGRALELGAGPGVFTRHLLPWTGPLTASDLSEPMCAAGRAALPQVTWRSMPAETPEEGPWDWLFSSSMLQWLADPPTVFRTWRSRLGPRGRLLAGLFAEGSLPEWRSLAGESGPVVWRSPEAWRRDLERAGFRILREEKAVRTFAYPTAREFLRSLHGVGAAPSRRLPAVRLRRLLAEYEKRYRRDEAVCATWIFFRFEAVPLKS